MPSRMTPSTQRPLRPVEPSQYVSAYRGELYRARAAQGGRIMQILMGAAVFFALLVCWRVVCGRDSWQIQAGWAALAAGILIGIDVLVRWGLGWRWFRTGALLGLLAVGAFWAVRLAIWGVIYWLGRGG
jgi:hypothetical protein